LNASAPMRRANWILLRNPTSLPKRARKGRNTLVPFLQLGFPRKSSLKSIATYARSIGVHIPRTTLVIAVGLRRMERRNLVSPPPRKAGYNWNTVNQNFAQLTDKIEKLEKALKKSGKKGKKRRYEDSNSDSK
jgi:hypothetical protein